MYLADVVEWYTRMSQKHVLKCLEVQILSSAKKRGIRNMNIGIPELIYFVSLAYFLIKGIIWHGKKITYKKMNLFIGFATLIGNQVLYYFGGFYNSIRFPQIIMIISSFVVFSVLLLVKKKYEQIKDGSIDKSTVSYDSNVSRGNFFFILLFEALKFGLLLWGGFFSS